MQCFRIEHWLGLHMRLGLAAILALFLAFAVSAAETGQIVDKLPRGYIGEFSWDGDKTVQNVVIKFESVRALNEKNVEAVGCGSYEVNRQITMIRVRMFVRMSDLYVEIFELAPQDNTTFETDGSHRGNLSNDLQSIDTQWTTRGSGQQGKMQLRAASSAVCAPASSL